MKVGISALLFNIEEAIEICKSEKCIKHIEVGIDNLEECEELIKYKKDFEKLGLSIGIHLPMELNTCENIIYIRNSWISFINEINKKLSDLNIEYFNMHLGYAITNRLENNRIKYLNNIVRFFNDNYLNSNIVISIENTYSKRGDFSNIGNNVRDFEYIFNNTMRKKLCFCYDTGHFLINKDNYINKLSEKLKIVHLSDNDGINDIHIGIGKGLLCMEHIKKVLEYNPEYLVLEIDYKDIKDTLITLKSL
ncbi:endonuclease [Romboutsia ilealis]|uniref:TIM barrel protein n=2 Tax=Romboutsia faecis TaxID=2764597 RepID=A0ABR7JRM6_9FIRM|nr:TIM barrel protein [Romboutsia faecis]MRN24935.1 endonuclease [Romboutsia ilealis]